MAKLTKTLNQTTITSLEIELTSDQLVLYKSNPTSFWSTYESEINSGWVLNSYNVTDIPEKVILVED
jgi:hypothetical protein|tara:strand:+ start:1462 stop:1662 length:201 start_codon:yes stop_codon:yes gene_type:complete